MNTHRFPGRKAFRLYDMALRMMERAIPVRIGLRHAVLQIRPRRGSDLRETQATGFPEIAQPIRDGHVDACGRSVGERAAMRRPVEGLASRQVKAGSDLRPFDPATAALCGAFVEGLLATVERSGEEIRRAVVTRRRRRGNLLLAAGATAAAEVSVDCGERDTSNETW